MELSDLTIFKTVAETGGITRAAEKLHRVPSNITARIQKLEQTLGKALFVRENNRLHISDAGQQLLEYAHQILKLADEARQALDDNHPFGALSIGAMEAVAATRLVEPLKQFHVAHPNVQLEVKTAPTGTLIEKVLSGKLDMAFVADPVNDPRLVIQPAYKEVLVMVSDLQHRKIKSGDDLIENPTVLGFSDQCAYRARLVNWLKHEGVIANTIELNSYHTILSCAAAGMGVGLVPQRLLDDYPFANSIQVHPLPAQWRKTVTALIWRQDATKSCMSSFAQFAMQSHAAKHHRS